MQSTDRKKETDLRTSAQNLRLETTHAIAEAAIASDIFTCICLVKNCDAPKSRCSAHATDPHAGAHFIRTSWWLYANQANSIECRW